MALQAEGLPCELTPYKAQEKNNYQWTLLDKRAQNFMHTLHLTTQENTTRGN